MTTARATLIVAAGIIGLAAVGIISSSGTPQRNASASAPTLQARDAAAARALADRNAAVRLVQEATNTTPASSCPRATSPDATRGAEAPSSETRALLSVFRRPANPLRGSKVNDPLGVMAEQGVNTAAVRRIDDADDRYVLVVPIENVNVAPYPTPACFAARRQRLDDLASTASPGVRREARAVLQMYRDAAARAPRGPREGVGLYRVMKNGDLSLETFSTAQIRRGTAFLSLTGRRAVSEFITVVPDGVASVDVLWPRRVSGAPHHKARTYPSAVLRRVPVRDNVAVATAPRPSFDALPARVTWRGADGRVVRRVTPVEPADLSEIIGPLQP